MYPIENRMSNTETPKDNGIMEPVANRGKAILTEVAPAPSNDHTLFND